MNEVLTRAEMETRFDGEWVLIAEPEMDENQVKKAAYLYLGPTPERVWLNAEQFLSMGGERMNSLAGRRCAPDVQGAENKNVYRGNGPGKPRVFHKAVCPAPRREAPPSE